MSTPLGQYAAPVAAIVAVLVIGAYVFALVFVPGLPVDTMDRLGTAALIALGAVFGSAVAVNGWKQPTQALGAKVDTHTAQIAALAGVVSESHPETSGTVGAIVAAAASGPDPAQAGG